MKNDLITWNRHKRQYLLNITGLVSEEVEPALKSCIENFYSLGIHRLNVNFGSEKGIIRERVLKELITNPLIETYEIDKNSVSSLEKESAVIIRIKDNTEANYTLNLDELDGVMQKGDALFRSLLVSHTADTGLDSREVRGAGELTEIFNAVYKAAPGTDGLLKWYILLGETGMISREDYSIEPVVDDIMAMLENLKNEKGLTSGGIESFLMLSRSFCLRSGLLSERVNVAMLAAAESASHRPRLNIKQTIDNFLKKIG